MSGFTFSTNETAWCPGCGNFAILKALVQALTELGKTPHEILLVGGIGQAAKTPQYVNANAFCGLHGRALPAAVAAKIANSDLTVIVDTGDGDSYGEGGNHFLHNIRRNVDITHFVHDNQIYGLTKGQASPTSDPCGATNDSACNMGVPFNPLCIALAAGATFVARGFSGEHDHLVRIMRAAIGHNGYALVDILQPCVTFNKRNTFAYYRERVRELDDSYDSGDRAGAMAKLMEDDGTLPVGIFYRQEEATYHQKNTVLSGGKTLVDLQVDERMVQEACGQFL